MYSMDTERGVFNENKKKQLEEVYKCSEIIQEEEEELEEESKLELKPIENSSQEL